GEAGIAVAETARALSRYASRLEADPAAQESVEARRELYARLQRKYRRTTDELLAWREELKLELAQGDDAEGSLARAQERMEACERAARAAATELSGRREEAAAKWSARISRELEPLGFRHARIAFGLRPAEAGHLAPRRP